MRDSSRTILTALATFLTLWLMLGFWPLARGSQLVLSLGVVLLSSSIFWFQWRQYRQRRAVSQQITDHILPPEDFQGAVVLVCGDTAPLFSDFVHFRETRSGWYLQVQNAEQLPLLAQRLATVRPALVSQVSVLLAFIPEQHAAEEDLIQSQRGWHRSLVQCRTWLAGIPPVWSVVWASPPGSSATEDNDAQWFTVTPDLPGVRVRQHGHVALPVTDWQWETDTPSRFRLALWLDSILVLNERYLSRPLSLRQGELPSLKFCAAGICLTPVSALTGNLLQQQISGITTLRPQSEASSGMLPLPDMLLPHLPRRHGISRRMQDVRLAGALCFTFLALACLASFVNNQRLVRSVSDHLAQYHQLSGTPPAPKEQAQRRLRADSRLLDTWLRQSEPLRYGLGLYQGLRLIPPVEAAISNWTPPPPPRPVIKKIITGPRTIRLDSMSLFDVGKWQLKSGSTKVLINALVGIKAKPGWLIVVAGHTDNTGDDASNQVLSLKRAESVRDWMRDTGDVPERCFAVQGYGESRPLKINDTDVGRAANRRVEISLVPQVNACMASGTHSVVTTATIQVQSNKEY
ncbi:cell envelope biogenesis protein OmpA [Citrobacter sp. NCU1]|uniref:OmpA family protein n=1 Tax=Citrobacter sp. NCU1 TaxID=2026683 RepID=UPI00139114ED|nr:OmpA family protein [Citrobacter sp. NCU1]NDO80648.1 cell envelope biogenesis protein OmpA [Citrobacter sp. NCU1]